MATVKKISIALTDDLAELVRKAVESGDYASTSEVIRNALRDWKLKRAARDEQAAALRSLGTLWLMNGQTDRTIELLRRTVALSPDDPVARLTLAQGLIEQDIERNTSEADGLLREVLRLSPQGEVAEKAKEALGKLAATRFRGDAGEGLRPDALHCCLDALERFDGMARDTLMPIVMEMANLGAKAACQSTIPRRKSGSNSCPANSARCSSSA